MIVTILQKIPVENKYLYYNVKEYLLEKTKQKMEGTCSKENGYILKVLEIEDILDNIIASSTCTVFFLVKYKAEVLKPIIGDILKGKICMIFQYGIFVDIMNKMKILIPIISINNFEYIDEEYIDKEGNILYKDMDVSIQILSLKYENKDFSCIGKLIL